jgi:hypothetical protein
MDDSIRQELLRVISLHHDFFRCTSDDECLKCESKAFGVLFLWYEPEDIGYLGYLCENHLIQSYLEDYKDDAKDLLVSLGGKMEVAHVG